MEKGTSVDVVILSFKPDDRFLRLIQMLKKQNLKPGRIIIINTEERYFPYSDKLKKLSGVEIHNISVKEFNHGESRNLGAVLSEAEFIIFMTQDAVPCDSELISELIKPMEDPLVAVSYARQLPAKTAGEIERYNRSFNYPDGDRLKTDRDFKELGIKTIFCSDVCACYRSSLFNELGGFVRTDFNEDMIFGYGAIKKGYGIYYASKAKVIHSHEYTVLQQFKRNISLGASQGLHPEVFKALKSEGEGKKLVRGCISNLIKKRKPWLIPVFILHCGARYSGFLLGKYAVPLFSKNKSV